MSQHNDGYGYAYTRARPGVKTEIAKFAKLPQHVQDQIPLLYWLLNEGTPPYKMDHYDSEYTDGPTPVPGETCDNCRFAWENVDRRKLYICSQIRGTIAPKGWCKLWKKWE